MGDDAVREAQRKADELNVRITQYEQKIAKAKSQLAEIKRFITQWEKFSGRPARPSDGGAPLFENVNSVDLARPTEMKSAVWKNPRKEAVSDAAAEILRESPDAMTRSQLFAALADRGTHIRGTNPEMILSTMLWRTRDRSGIVRLKSGGYCLSDRLPDGDESGKGELD